MPLGRKIRSIISHRQRCAPPIQSAQIKVRSSTDHSVPHINTIAWLQYRFDGGHNSLPLPLGRSSFAAPHCSYAAQWDGFGRQSSSRLVLQTHFAISLPFQQSIIPVVWHSSRPIPPVRHSSGPQPCRPAVSLAGQSISSTASQSPVGRLGPARPPPRASI